MAERHIRVFGFLPPSSIWSQISSLVGGRHLDRRQQAAGQRIGISRASGPENIASTPPLKVNSGMKAHDDGREKEDRSATRSPRPRGNGMGSSCPWFFRRAKLGSARLRQQPCLRHPAEDASTM